VAGSASELSGAGTCRSESLAACRRLPAAHWHPAPYSSQAGGVALMATGVGPAPVHLSKAAGTARSVRPLRFKAVITVTADTPDATAPAPTARTASPPERVFSRGRRRMRLEGIACSFEIFREAMLTQLREKPWRSENGCGFLRATLSEFRQLCGLTNGLDGIRVGHGIAGDEAFDRKLRELGLQPGR
jgi:hypothetical protein